MQQMLLRGVRSSLVATLVDMTFAGTVFSPNSVTVTLNVSTTQLTRTINLGSPVNMQEWNPAGSSTALFEMRATSVSGTLPTGTLNTWVDIGATSWAMSRNTTGTSTGVITLEIRDKATTAVLAAANMTLTATVNP